MRDGFRFAILAATASVWAVAAAGQQKAEKPVNPARLELMAEVAATTEDGYPAALRVTVKNVGNVAVDMPMPKFPCVPGGGGVDMRFEWHPNDPEDHTGALNTGSGCWEEHFANLMDRVHRDWIRLQPGDFITVSESFRGRFQNLKPGTVEYWVEYVPPEVKTEELIELQRSGYVIPTERIETVHQTFTVH